MSLLNMPIGALRFTNFATVWRKLKSITTKTIKASLIYVLKRVTGLDEAL